LLIITCISSGYFKTAITHFLTSFWFGYFLLAVPISVHFLKEVHGVFVVVADGQEAEDVVEVSHRRKQSPRSQIAQSLEVPNAKNGSKFLVRRNSEMEYVETRVISIFSKPDKTFWIKAEATFYCF